MPLYSIIFRNAQWWVNIYSTKWLSMCTFKLSALVAFNGKNVQEKYEYLYYCTIYLHSYFTHSTLLVSFLHNEKMRERSCANLRTCFGAPAFEGTVNVGANQSVTPTLAGQGARGAGYPHTSSPWSTSRGTHPRAEYGQSSARALRNNCIFICGASVRIDMGVA